MPISVLTPAVALKVTTVNRVKDELGVALNDSTPDRAIKRYINSITDYVATETGRVFPFQRYQEGIRSNGDVLLMVQNTPIRAVEKVNFKQRTSTLSTLTSTQYSLDDPQVGNLYKEDGWDSTLRRVHFIEPQPLGIEKAAPNWLVTYSAGYNMPELYDKSEFGTSTNGYSGTSTLSTNSFSTLAARFPADLEDACVQLIVSKYIRKGEDGMVKSQRTGEASETLFDASGVPPYFANVLRKYTPAY